MFFVALRGASAPLHHPGYAYGAIFKRGFTRSTPEMLEKIVRTVQKLCYATCERLCPLRRYLFILPLFSEAFEIPGKAIWRL